VDFLEQLCVAIPSTEEEVEDLLRKKTKTVRKLELRLADRRKPSDDGCACVSFVRLSISAILCRRAFGTRAHHFPRGMGASILPFGRDY
jgi:hypothetical protein